MAQPPAGSVYFDKSHPAGFPVHLVEHTGSFAGSKAEVRHSIMQECSNKTHHAKSGIALTCIYVRRTCGRRPYSEGIMDLQ